MMIESRMMTWTMMTQHVTTSHRTMPALDHLNHSNQIPAYIVSGLV